MTTANNGDDAVQLKRDCYVAVDFDGTCVTHAYPKVGDDIGADVWLRPAFAMGAKLILWTIRDGEKLARAREWFEGHDIPLWAVNENPDQKEWSSSRKVFAHIYIDDAGMGVPMRVKGPRDRPYLDWNLIGPLLLRRIAGILNQ